PGSARAWPAPRRTCSTAPSWPKRWPGPTPSCRRSGSARPGSQPSSTPTGPRTCCTRWAPTGSQSSPSSPPSRLAPARSSRSCSGGCSSRSWSACSAPPTPTCAGWRRCCAAATSTGSACAPRGWSARKRPAATAWTRAGHCPKRAASPAPTWPPPCWTPSIAPTSTAGPHTSPTNAGRTPRPPRRNPRLTGCPREPNLMPQRRRPGPPSNCRCAAERRSGPVRDYRDCRFDGVTPETEETPVTDVTTSQDQEQPGLSAADEQVLRELTERARAGGLRLTGEGGLLGKLTKMVVEGALEGELDGHLGYGKHDPG